MASRSHNTCKAGQKALGTAVVLVLSVMMIMTFNIAIVGYLLVRGAGEEAVLLSQNIPARKGLEVGFTRLSQSINAYLVDNGGPVTNSGLESVDTEFAQGGGSDIANETLTLTDPETDTTETTPVRITAWLESRRGSYYELKAQAVFGDISLTSTRWVKMNPCGANGSLTKIVEGRTQPGLSSSLVDPQTGRIYFGEVASPGNLYTWINGDTTPTVIMGGLTNPGAEGTMTIDSLNDRLFFADASKVYAWSHGTLSTLASGLTNPTQLTVDSTTGRVFFGDGSGSANFYTWSNGTLSTLETGMQSPLYAAADPVSGRIYFRETDNPGKMMTWRDNTLATIADDLNTTGVTQAMSVDLTTGRLFFRTSGSYLTWSNGSLSTIMPSLSAGSSAVNSSTGQIFMANPLGYGTWYDDVVITAMNVEGSAGQQSVVADPGRNAFYFTQGGSSGHLYRWSDGTLSTLHTGPYPGSNNSLAVDTNTGRIFFGEDDNNGNFYTWSSGTLSTLVSTRNHVGAGSTAVFPPTGRVYFGQNDASGHFYTWANGTLSTITSSIGPLNAPGYRSTKVDPTSGRVFFGTNNSLYSWLPPEACEK